ncbi:MAG: hypothetical protein J6W94_04145 [Bacteroidales bacterium]|nr:hypothetical protein [Bacteroidales bacterium]
MIYAIIIIATVVALFLIFRDDHNSDYNKSEKGYRKSSGSPRNTTASAAPKPNPLKSEIEKAIKEAKSTWEPPVQETVEPEEEEDEPDLSFLDKISYYEDLEENTETFDITGLRYYCTVHDCGKIVGIVKPEPSNTHDPRAQAVIRSDGKLLGYIPRTQQDWYEDFNEQNVVCPFVGEIELDRSNASLVAEIKVIIPSSREFVEEQIGYI